MNDRIKKNDEIDISHEGEYTITIPTTTHEWTGTMDSSALVPHQGGLPKTGECMAAPKTAMISGAGQDASYLSEFLLEKGYKVIVMVRRTSTGNTSLISHLLSHDSFLLTQGDVTDSCNLQNLLREHQPDEFYNLAAQSHVGTSFKVPASTFDITGKGCLNVLEAIRTNSPHTRFYQASSSEMFGDQCSLTPAVWSDWNTYRGKPYQQCLQVEEKYQDEDTPFNPKSPYAIAKLAAHHTTRLYREMYGLFAVSGILFNHESPRRGEDFVTRKITKWLGEFLRHVKEHEQVFELGSISIWENMDDSYPKLRLGNLDASRDWGHSRDYVEAMWLMLQAETPTDYVVGTGETHTVKNFLQEAFQYRGLEWEDHVVIDPDLVRPAEVPYLRARAYKIKAELGWEPKTNFQQLVEEMVEADG